VSARFGAVIRCSSASSSASSSSSSSGSGGAIHTAAATGFSKENVQRYETGRPDYSAEALDKIINIIESSKKETAASYKGPSSLCEIGAGTGKFTKSFISAASKRFDKLDMLAVEPSEFVDHLRDLNLPGVDVKIGTGEKIPAADNTMHAVMIAQAFHWMANTACLVDIHRVLTPGSPLILVWNGYDSRVDWINEFESNIIIPRYPKPPDHVPRFQSMEWKEVFDTPEAKELFTAPRTEYSTQIIVGDIDMLINRALSTSIISNKPASVHAEVAEEVRKLMQTHPATKGQSRFELVYRTHIVYMTKK
jgi:ubiquinone/menaquinone biosynthesis C-methylase UbiE